MKDRDIQGPENVEPGIDSRELGSNVVQFKRTTALTAFLSLTLLLQDCGGNGGPVVSPELQTKTPNIFVPTETPTPTEKPAAEYKALLLDITSLVEANPDTIAQEYKDLQTSSLNLAKEMAEFKRRTPHIWSLSVADDGPKIDENMILAQNQTTNEFYALLTIAGAGQEAKTTLLKEKIYAEVVMGDNGNFENLSYYYLELDGTKKEFIRSNPETNGGYIYTMTDGNEVELDDIPIVIGEKDDPTGKKALFSIVPPQENFYESLPSGAIINTEKGLITHNGEIIYHYDEKWIVQPKLEQGEPLEFSPLLPAVWSKEWIGKAEGMDIPITIGLSERVYNDKIPPITPIKGVWMTQEGADAVADSFLRSTHYRYTKIMGNEISYEDYLEILKNEPHGNEVNLLITDNELDTDGKPIRREALIDPRQGFSLLITDGIDPEISVKANRVENVFFGVDGRGRFLYATSHFSQFEYYHDYIEFGLNTKEYTFVYNNFTIMNLIGYIENKCLMNNNVESTCGQQMAPMEIKDWWQMLFDRQKEMITNNSLILDFGLVNP